MNTQTYISGRILGTFVAIVISLAAQAHSGSEDQRQVRADVESKLASFRLNAAEQRADQLSDAGYRAFYKSTILVYKYMASQDGAYLQSFRNGFDAATSAVSSVSDSDPLKKVMLSDLYCKRAVLEFLTENYLTAVRYTRTGRNYIRENQTAFPNNVEQKRILGLFNVILGAVPSKYQWLTNMLGYEGNVNSGIRQLEEAASSSSTLLRLESQFILYYVERNMLNLNESAIRRIEGERSRIGGSILLDFLVASANQSIKQNEKSLAILVQRDKYVSSDIFFIPYWDYLLGKAYYYKDDHTHAQQSLARFLKGYKGKMFRTDANFRLGMSLSLSGAYSSGKYFFQLVANETGGNFDEDQYAAHMAKKFSAAAPGSAILSLFRARNLFDGGYYDRAIAVLRPLDSQSGQLSPGERSELAYRYGRIYHSQGKLDMAISHYRQCTQTVAPEEYKWLQAFSYYYIGDIARQQGNRPAARTQFEKVLTFTNYYYQTGLENRTKIALSQLK